jgi:hypothetical protein
MNGWKLTPSEQSTLTQLSWHWEGGYENFTVTGDGIWQASPVGEPATVLTAGSAEELREKIRADYAGRQARRNAGLHERMST